MRTVLRHRLKVLFEQCLSLIYQAMDMMREYIIQGQLSIEHEQDDLADIIQFINGYFKYIPRSPI